VADEPKTRASDPSHTSLPPELKAFPGAREWAKAEVRDAAEVDAVFAEAEALVAQIQAKADAADAKRGVGNVQEYVAPTGVPEHGASPAEHGDSKVAIAMADVPRSLPAGNPALPTQEIRRPEFHRAGRTGRTVGGNTEKIAVIAPVEVPSAASATPARDRAGTTSGATRAGAALLLVGALAAVAVLALRGSGAGTTSVTSAATGSSHVPVPHATGEPAASAHVDRSVPSSVPTTTAVSPPATALPRPSVQRPTTPTPHEDDPYQDAAVPTASPSVSAAPPQPPPPARSPVEGDRVFGN
jgi:hypothetical protein